MSDKKVNIEINSEVNEIFAKTIVTQKFKNPESNPLELKIYVYKKENIIFSSFSAQIGDSIKIKSKVIKKEKAEEKYNDSITSGNAAIYVHEKYSNRIVINMGNIPPNEELILISEFIQLTESSKSSYEFELFRNLPIFIGNGSTYQNGNLKGKIEIKTKNKVLKLEKEILLKNLEIIEEKNKEEQPFNYLVQYQVLELPEFNSYYDNSEYIPSSKIYFYTEENKNSPIIYCQKSDSIKNEKSYIINYKNNQNNKNTDNLELNPALFIFLIDQSGSMSGNPIKIVSKALELFLQSIPVGSYYQLIGFGSNFKKYDETPKSYTSENIKNSINIIKTLSADLGGTNIYQPLKNIYENKNTYNEIKLPKNIFLLTDGEIGDKKETLELIEKYSSEFSIFSIGIGNYFDKDLIKNSGIIGKGGFNFCKDLDSLNSIIIKEINKCISPYISNFSMKSSLDEKHLYKTFDIPEIVRKNEIVNLGFITEDDSTDNNKIKIDLEYLEDNNKKNISYEIIPEIIKDGNELMKLIINNYLTKDLDLKIKEELAIKYQLLTEFTSLFAEIELSDKISDELKSKILEPHHNYKKNIPDNYNLFYDNNSNINSYKVCPRNVVLSEACSDDVDDEDECYIENDEDEDDEGLGACYCENDDDEDDDYDDDDKDYKVSNYKYENNNCMNSMKYDEKDSKETMLKDLNINDNKINNNSNNNNKLVKNDLMEIINTQDFIEGFWGYNEHTKYVKEKYEKEYEILIKDKILNNNEKIIITILMIYFIEKDYPELLNELSLVIKKAKIFINKETKNNYEEIIKQI